MREGPRRHAAALGCVSQLGPTVREGPRRYAAALGSPGLLLLAVAALAHAQAPAGDEAWPRSLPSPPPAATATPAPPPTAAPAPAPNPATAAGAGGVRIISRPDGFELAPSADAPPAPLAPADVRVPAPPAAPTPAADDLADLLRQVAPGREVREPSPAAAADADVAAILERARQGWAFLAHARSAYMESETVLVQTPAAFEVARRGTLGPDQSLLRVSRYVGWDAQRVACYVASPQSRAWAQWLGREGVVEYLPGAAAGATVRAAERRRELGQVLAFALSPYLQDIPVGAWWTPSSSRDVQAWRPPAAYRSLGRHDFLGQPCAVLAYQDGADRGEEWFDLATGRLVRVRAYLPVAADAPPDALSAVAPPSRVRRDRVLLDYREVVPGQFLPHQAVESIRSTASGELMSVLHVTLRRVKLDEPLPDWLLDPSRDGPR